MRTPFAETVNDADADDLLTTGEAARLLGTSRQHVVDLCRVGDLPYVLVGQHRRVTRRDVELLRTGSRKLTKDQERSLWLSHVVAAKLVQDPVGVLNLARQNLAQMKQGATRGSARIWLREWEALLDGPIEELLEALTSRSPRSRELRQNTPFAGVIRDSERTNVLDAFRNKRLVRSRR